MNKNINSKKDYIKIKSERREKKKTERRHATAEEVIYIFEKVLEGWRTIRIYNTIIQTNPKSLVLKKNVENISTGNSKVYKDELNEERFNYYTELRAKVYEYNKKQKSLSKSNESIENQVNYNEKNELNH
jgi:hypothetical protein